MLAPEALAAFERTIARGRELLGERTLWNVNSTARGGGVAEMLQSLLGYVQGAGLDARWVVIAGDPAFFTVTKRLHNRLHGHAGDGGDLGAHEREVYEACSARNAEELAARLRPGDVVLLHDPQTAGMVPRLCEAGVRVIWRAHIGLDLPNDLAREAWRFLTPYVQPADAYVFSRDAYRWPGLDERARDGHPSVDRRLRPEEPRDGVHQRDGRAARRRPRRRPPPARPRGVRAARRQRRARRAPRHDDRGGAAPARRAAARAGVALGPAQGPARRARRLRRVRRHRARNRSWCWPDPTSRRSPTTPRAPRCWRRSRRPGTSCRERVRRRVHLALLPMDDRDENAIIVNALQRRADVVAQKSLAEGFGLTVAEAMWKARPVVASRVGGIQDQIVDGRTGHLVEPTTWPASAPRVPHCSTTPMTPSGSARPRRRACATRSSGRGTSASTSTCSTASSRARRANQIGVPLMTSSSLDTGTATARAACRPRLPARASGGLRHRIPRVPLAGDRPVQLGARLVRRARRRRWRAARAVDRRGGRPRMPALVRRAVRSLEPGGELAARAGRAARRPDDRDARQPGRAVGDRCWRR